MTIDVFVVGHAHGEPCVVPVRVTCSKEQYGQGEHYSAARRQAENARGITDPVIEIDAHDEGFRFFDSKSWTGIEVEFVSIQAQEHGKES